MIWLFFLYLFFEFNDKLYVVFFFINYRNFGLIKQKQEARCKLQLSKRNMEQGSCLGVGDVF